MAIGRVGREGCSGVKRDGVQRKGRRLSPFLCIGAIEESGRGRRRGFRLLGAGFAHRFAAKFDAICVMHEAVEDAVGDGGVADLFVPLGHGDL